MQKLLNWNYKELSKIILGILIYSMSIKFFILPNNLYNGGIMGLSQLIRTFILNVTDLKFGFDISSVIYYLLNIPIFIIAYKKIGKTFCFRSLFCVTLNTLFLLVIPSISKPITDELLTNIFVGGLLCGTGTGLIIGTGASTGGTDIIGMCITKKSRKITVGGFNLMFNMCTYGICGIMNGIEIMVYSILYSVFDSFMVDKLHTRNISSTVLIFTKKDPGVITKCISNDLKRDATYWEAVGGYTKSKTYIIYAVLSKYETMQLQFMLNKIDDTAFIVTNDGVSVKGNFEKKLQ